MVKVKHVGMAKGPTKYLVLFGIESVEQVLLNIVMISKVYAKLLQLLSSTPGEAKFLHFGSYFTNHLFIKGFKRQFLGFQLAKVRVIIYKKAKSLCENIMRGPHLVHPGSKSSRKKLI